jgi:hypothetical protein
MADPEKLHAVAMRSDGEKTKRIDSKRRFLL